MVDCKLPVIEQFVGKTISGQKLNELLGGMPLLKFMNDDDVHFGMQYVTGNNLDILSFNGSGDCCKGGLYVTTLKYFIHFYDRYGAYARRVRINPDALVHVEINKLKCDEIYLEDKILKDDLLKILFMEYLQYLDNLSKDVMEDFLLSMVVVKSNGYVIQFISEDMRTPELLIEAVKNNGYALQFINDDMKTPELLMEAVKSTGYALQFINDEMRTPELLIEAVKNNGNVLQLISEDMRTPELLMEAVKGNGSVLSLNK